MPAALRPLSFVPVVVLLLASAAAVADAPAKAAKRRPSEFIRYTDVAGGGGKVDVAIVSYRNARTGQTVDLVGAVHVADRAFFRALNARFDGYDAVLYEMVRPRDMDAPPQPGHRGGHAIGGLQIAMTKLLDLTYQLDEVDYDKPHFVHADMDAETFAERQEARGESFATLLLRSMMNEMNRPRTARGGKVISQEVQGMAIMGALLSPDRPRQLKLVLGQQFQDLDAQIAGLEGPDGSVILTERNAAAMKVLRDQLAAGKKRVAVFYGAAHLKGMEKDLVGPMGFEPVRTEWLTAWDIPPAPATQPVAK